MRGGRPWVRIPARAKQLVCRNLTNNVVLVLPIINLGIFNVSVADEQLTIDIVMSKIKKNDKIAD